MGALSGLSARALDRFSDWFSGVGGVWQQIVLVLVWTVVEVINPRLDPSFLKWMAILTIYSAITQPALAYVARRGSEKTDHDHERDAAILAHIEKVITEKLEQK